MAEFMPYYKDYELEEWINIDSIKKVSRVNNNHAMIEYVDGTSEISKWRFDYLSEILGSHLIKIVPR